ncbi:hypothetical protein [Actinophytocola sp.]|uniref:hypothetical protein n=1 Tax=Actinophytocola sp. TaxID=1872138 RepID=UPI002ECFFCE9
MSVVLAVVQVTAAVLLSVPLVIAAVHALRRADRQIDDILREECEPVPSSPEIPSTPPGRVIRPAGGASARDVVEPRPR